MYSKHSTTKLITNLKLKCFIRIEPTKNEKHQNRQMPINSLQTIAIQLPRLETVNMSTYSEKITRYYHYY